MDEFIIFSTSSDVDWSPKCTSSWTVTQLALKPISHWKSLWSKESSPKPWWSILRELVEDFQAPWKFNADTLLKFVSHGKDCRTILIQCYIILNNNWTQVDCFCYPNILAVVLSRLLRCLLIQVTFKEFGTKSFIYVDKFLTNLLSQCFPYNIVRKTLKQKISE